MPVNGFSVGKDVSLTVVTSTGSISTLGLISFNSKQGNIKIKSKRISDGKTHHGKIPDGWSGTFKFDRLDPSLDIYFANEEAGYYAGQNIPPATIQEINQEADGSISTWRYDEVVLYFDDAGNWEADKKVEQTVSFDATDKVRVS